MSSVRLFLRAYRRSSSPLGEISSATRSETALAYAIRTAAEKTGPSSKPGKMVGRMSYKTVER